MLSVIEPAARRSLTTVSRFRDASPPVDMPDEALERLILRCSAMIESYLGRTLARERVVELARDAPSIWLARTPVLEIHYVVLDGEAVAGSRLEGDGLLHFPTEISFEAMWRDLGGAELGDARRPLNYAVEYTGGYLLPGDDEMYNGNDVELPPELELMTIQVVRGEIDLMRRGDIGLTSERLGDASRSYASTTTLDRARTILDRHRRHTV